VRRLACHGILSPGVLRGGPSGLRVRVGVGPGRKPLGLDAVRQRQPWPSDAGPLVSLRRRLPFRRWCELESPAAWMGGAAASGAARFESRGPWLEVATAVRCNGSCRHAAQATAPGRHIRGIVLGRHRDSRSVWPLSGVQFCVMYNAGGATVTDATKS
jgi:hypothetical protein